MFNLNSQVSEAHRQELLREAEHARLVREARASQREADKQRAQIEHSDESLQPNLKRQYAK
ncbi:MAG: hypothetical protein SGI73_09560 [Chloroflexota bacterium]|nr:hypothetical protein [Chloroflexota bacterium]